MTKVLVATLITLIAIAILIPVALAQQGPEINVSNGWGDQADIATDSNGDVHIAFTSACGSYYETFGVSPNRYTVITWDVSNYDETDWGVFQAVLYESGTIDVNIDFFAYDDDGWIVGVNQNSANGVSISGTPSDCSSYRFTWDGVSDYNSGTIPWNWIGTAMNCTGAGGDDSSIMIPLGFNFTFYGTSYDTVYVSSNGYMSFTITDPDSYTPPTVFPTANTEAENVIAPLWSDWCPDCYRQIWYTMLDNYGNTLIDNTLVSSGTSAESTRPAIAVDSDNDVHILWRDQRWDGGSSQEVTYSMLRPSLDDQDGSAANPAVISIVDDTRLSDIGDWYIYQIRMAIDSTDDIHIVWDDYDADIIYYMKIDENGNELIAETDIHNGWLSRGLPDIAVDSGDNVHVVWADGWNVTNDEIYYMMLNSSGSIMINATRLTPDDGWGSKRPRIVIDSDDNAHVTWHSKVDDTDNHEIYYTKLDPSLAPGSITVINDTALTPYDGNDSQHQAMGIGCGQYIHVTWYEYDTDENVHYMILNKDGSQILGDMPLSSSGQATSDTYWTLPYIDVDLSGKAHMTWTDYRNDIEEVFYTNYEGQLCIVGQSSDPSGTVKDIYYTDENVYAMGTGFVPGRNVDIYVKPDLTWYNGDNIPPDISSDGMNTVMPGTFGNIAPTLIWPGTLPVGQYDIVFDTAQNFTYDFSIDAVDNPHDPGFIVIERPAATGGGGPTVGGEVMLVNKVALVTQQIALPIRLMMGFVL